MVGHPEGTTSDSGCDVGRRNDPIIDVGENELRQEREMLSSMVNITDSLRNKLNERISAQRAFDKQPLTRRLCWQFGCVPWGDGSAKGTYIIDPPKGMRTKNAPANAFFKAVNNSSLTFEHCSTKSSVSGTHVHIAKLI